MMENHSKAFESDDAMSNNLRPEKLSRTFGDCLEEDTRINLASREVNIKLSSCSSYWRLFLPFLLSR
jgi:hypothetical protein